jgi:hypothetical protein
MKCEDVKEYIEKIHNPFLNEPFDLFHLYFAASKSVEEFATTMAKNASTKCLDLSIRFYNRTHRQHPISFSKEELEAARKFIYDTTKETFRILPKCRGPYDSDFTTALKTVEHYQSIFGPERMTDKLYNRLALIQFRNSFYAVKWYLKHYISNMSKDEFMSKWIRYWMNPKKHFEGNFKKCAYPYMIRYGAVIYEISRMK